MIDWIGRLREIYTRLTVLYLGGGRLALVETGGTITTDGGVQIIWTIETPLGVFKALKMQIDFTAQTAGEVVVVRTYYRIKDGGDLIKKDEVTYAGVQDPDLVNIELEPNRFGIQVTIEKTAGDNKAYDWAVFTET